ncbi:hypothetical protein [Synechococcus phage S-H38]|uniref:DUF3310 domain-containing protein n=1 Tax=Synechococcus phage S-H38 TaxID=2783673 RepID=A0A873WSF7_9CAUD|nr:nucleotide kinase [Synechococcus phage S-H38]QPB08004.1 hypothetical protein [Synechococcus phage S-H38]
MRKYSETETIKELEEYISGTYQGHYTAGNPNGEQKVQTLDLIESIGDAEGFCRSNAIKYLSRFGKKNGRNKRDLLKALHYVVLLYHFAGCHKNGNGLSEYKV